MYAPLKKHFKGLIEEFLQKGKFSLHKFKSKKISKDQNTEFIEATIEHNGEKRKISLELALIYQKKH